MMPGDRELLEQLDDRVGDRRADRRDVVEIDADHRLGGDRPQERGAQIVRR